MLLRPWDLGSLLAILAIILLSSSVILSARKSMMSKRLELTGNIVGIAFLAVACYLIWESII